MVSENFAPSCSAFAKHEKTPTANYDFARDALALTHA